MCKWILYSILMAWHLGKITSYIIVFGVILTQVTCVLPMWVLTPLLFCSSGCWHQCCFSRCWCWHKLWVCHVWVKTQVTCVLCVGVDICDICFVSELKHVTCFMCGCLVFLRCGCWHKCWVFQVWVLTKVLGVSGVGVDTSGGCFRCGCWHKCWVFQVWVLTHVLGVQVWVLTQVLGVSGVGVDTSVGCYRCGCCHKCWVFQVWMLTQVLGVSGVGVDTSVGCFRCGCWRGTKRRQRSTSVNRRDTSTQTWSKCDSRNNSMLRSAKKRSRTSLLCAWQWGAEG